MELFQLIGIAFLTAVTALLLRSTRPELSFAVTVAGCIILLLIVLDLVKDGLSVFGEIAETSGIDASLIKILLKMIGIGYLVEFSAGILNAGILNDFGQNSVADKLVFAGKILVFVLAIPILESVVSLVGTLIGLI